MNSSLNAAGKVMSGLKIGIFALQGDFDLHASKLIELGIEPSFVRMPHELNELDGLIIPGGESGAYLRLMKPINMDIAIKSFAQSKGLLTTCAGTITIAKQVTNPIQDSLNLIDIDIQRNAYGRQRDSVDTTGHSEVAEFPDPLAMTFIRAPKITRMGNDIIVLATYRGDPVLVQANKIIACTYHPELSTGLEVYEYWLKLLAN
jgi:5'-phosphate synthase pdxT subunit